MMFEIRPSGLSASERTADRLARHETERQRRARIKRKKVTPERAAVIRKAIISTAPKAIIYTRVSHEEQARDGVSLAAQEAQARAYCKAKDWQVHAVIREQASAKDVRGRPKLQGILADVPRNGQRGWEVLLVTKLDRLTRSVRDLSGMVDTFAKGRVQFASVSESVDTTSATGGFFVTLLGALAEMERRQVGERTRVALQHLKSQGKRVSGWAPFGYRFRGGKVIPFPSELDVLRRIKQLRSGGHTLKEISIRLAKNGQVNRNGRPFAVSALSFMARGIERRAR